MLEVLKKFQVQVIFKMHSLDISMDHQNLLINKGTPNISSNCTKTSEDFI